MKVSDGYLELVDKFIFQGVELRHMNMTDEQRLRAMIAYEAYQVWISNKQIKPVDLCRRIAQRIYSDMLERARHDETYAELCRKLSIRAGVPRDYSRIANDVATLDHIIGRFSAPSLNIERAKVVDASDWLITEGMKTGNDRSVSNGAALKMKLHKDFDEEQAGYEKIAETDINITGDVSVVKKGTSNYTDEEKRLMAKRFGVTEKEVEELILNDKGEYETAPMNADPEPDIFESAENEK